MNDPIAKLAQFLAGHVEWMRHRQEAAEFLTAVDACARVMRGLARGPAEQKYLGPCGAALFAYGAQPEDETVGYCEGDVYGIRGASDARCRDCGATVASRDREAWLDAEVRSHAFRASEIAGAYNVNVKTIRTWHARGQLAPHGHDTEGRPLFNLGDVLDLAAADTARRATEQARRARRRERATHDDGGRLSA